ncbi:hypothetical protein ACFVHW_36105 [Streptomyces sp. NPDC127110]|uniref:hypothetical protein n=1 Tax=Streptomyces sp. NPDC127110 TaxID=3345362 RepID=UPI003628E804
MANIWAGAITRTSEDQYQLSLRCLLDERASLRRAIARIRQRLAVPCGQRAGDVRGYPNPAERTERQRRLQVLTARLADVEARIEAGRPAIVVGGRRPAKVRHHLTDAGLSESGWRERWRAARLFQGTKTCRDRIDQLALLPVSQDHRGDNRQARFTAIRPAAADIAGNGESSSTGRATAPPRQ